MNADGLAPEIARAFEKTAAFYRLTDAEKDFVLRVLTRIKTLAMEARENLVKTAGRFPQTNQERMVMAVGLFILNPDNPSLHEELLVGLHKQPRPELILEVLREIVRFAFPPGIVAYMVDVFS